MKISKKKTALLLLGLGAGVAALAGCKSTAKVPINFVAVEGKEWNVSVNIGDYAYKFSGKISGSNGFVLKGITQGKAQQSGGGGKRLYLAPGESSEEGSKAEGSGETSGDGSKAEGSGETSGDGSKAEGSGETSQGGDGSKAEGSGETSQGGDGSKAEGSGETSQGGQPSSQGGQPAASSEEEDFSSHDFEIQGTISETNGYGYVINLKDEWKTEGTTLHVDYNKTEGRHEFYYNVKVGDNNSIVKFQAKDSTYSKKLASDYKSWDVRDSKYVCYAKATGNNNSVATAYLYLHNTDNEVVENTPSGTNRAMSFGKKWSENNGVITITDPDTGATYTSIASVNSEHPGFKIKVGSNTYVHSSNPDVRWKAMSNEDFDGKNKYQFTGSYTTSGPVGSDVSVELNLGETGKAFMYSNGATLMAEGTWTEDASKVVTVDLGSKVLVSQVNADEQRYFVYEWVESGNKGDTNYSVTLIEKK